MKQTPLSHDLHLYLYLREKLIEAFPDADDETIRDTLEGITTLKELLAVSAQKYPTLDTSLILKSLVYFDDVLREPIMFKEGHEVSFEAVKDSLRKVVADHFAR